VTNFAYTAEIIGIGTELLLGNTANTDAQDVSRALSEIGINVYFHTVVGDNPERVKQAVDIAKRRADIIITTGGLGPTFDDLTKQTVAGAFGKKLVYSEAEARKIRDYFETRSVHMEMTENNLRQAMLPEGCTIFDNGCGTAPGCAFFSEGKHVLMLPGPPRECLAMMTACGIPYLKKLSKDIIRSHNIHIFGMGESAVESRLHELMERLDNPTLAPYAKDGEVMLRCTAKADSAAAAEELMAPVLKQVRDVLGDLIYGIDTGSLENTVITLLRENNKPLAVAESCTGGQLAGRLTDIPGASQVFPGGVVAYSTASKTALLGIPADYIEQNGVVSAGVAREMAAAARTIFSADIGVGITGLADTAPDGSTVLPGTVYVAIATDSGTSSTELRSAPDRHRVRVFAASTALDLVRRELTA
jgi:nicotinamide-nucleotide amidase